MIGRQITAFSDKLPPIDEVKNYIKSREEDPKLKAMLSYTIAKNRETKYDTILYDEIGIFTL